MTQSYITNLQSSVLTNQNIFTTPLLATWTNTTRARKIVITVQCDQIVGNGNYTIYATRQRSGAGSAYEIGARVVVAVPSGVAAQAFPTIALVAGATDVIKVYILALSGDTTTPDTTVDFDEEFVGVGADGKVLISTDAQDLSGSLSVNTKTITAGAIAATTFAANALDAVWSTAARTLTAIADSAGVTTLLTRIVGTLLTGNHNPQSGDAYSRIGAAGAGLTAIGDTRMANLDAAITTRTKPADTQAAVTNLTNLPTVPTDWLAAAGVKADAVTKIQNGLATPTNITAGTITTATNLTNLPSIPAGWLTAAGIAAAALNGKGDWNTTTPLDAAGVRTAIGLAAANLDAQIMALAAYVDTVESLLGTPAGASIAADLAAIKTKADDIQTKVTPAAMGPLP